ncbi:MAG: hypothetical protein WDZ80_03690 [Candidatus Paceibacterota bacterium]
MTKNKFNSKLREYSKTLSPKLYEQDLIGKVYQSFNDLFGVNNCVQIGSYPRFTSITPIHDLDILYILGSWDENNHIPSATLQNLFNEINSSYVNPTNYTKKVSLQTHSITVEFWENTNMILSVDVVPAYSHGKNEYNQDTYRVPEVIKEKNHAKRNVLTWNASDSYSWINSDPRGYIKIATEVGVNTDFRKTVKFVKRWKNTLCDQDQDLKLKSFHLEQVVTKIFKQNSNIEIFDAIFIFFVNLPGIINTPNQIQDRANSDKFIDDYLAKLTSDQKTKIGYARDSFLMNLENLKDSDPAEDLIAIDFYKRPSSEVFMFDQNIKILTEDEYDFKISGEVQVRNGGFREFILDKIGLITIDRKIKFLISGSSPSVDIFKWKVKNDNSSDEPRGEITDHHTKNEVENTRYSGNHYVECYAVKDNICVAKARQNVVLNGS